MLVRQRNILVRLRRRLVCFMKPPLSFGETSVTGGRTSRASLLFAVVSCLLLDGVFRQQLRFPRAIRPVSPTDERILTTIRYFYANGTRREGFSTENGRRVEKFV